MNKKIVFAAAAIVLAGGLLYFVRHTKQPPKEQTLGLIGRPRPVVETICTENIQNYSHQPVNMEGIDDALVAQLQKVGFKSSRKIGDPGRACDATMNAELVEISDHSRKTARVDYRLTLAGEIPPRISASVEGKSADGSSAKFASNFKAAELVAAQKPDKMAANREALVAALAEQARQVQEAYRNGMQPWLKKVE